MNYNSNQYQNNWGNYYQPIGHPYGHQQHVPMPQGNMGYSAPGVGSVNIHPEGNFHY